MSNGTISNVDHSFDGLTEEEIEARIAKEMVENSMTEMEKLRRDNPTLNDAWEQIKMIRELSKMSHPKDDRRPGWQRAYDELVEGVTTDNAALRDAWDQYYTLKKLLGE